MQASTEPVQAEYIRQLCRASSALDDQLADVYHVLAAVTDGANLGEESPLGSARAAYVAHLRESQLTFDQLVADIAAVCASAYFRELVT